MSLGLAVERGSRLGVLGRLSVVTTLVVVAAFPHRLEYVAHVLAGFGLAALGLALAESEAPGRVGDRLARVGGRVPDPLAPGGRAGVAMGLVVAGALVWELTLGGPLDVLDAANTVMGGLLGVAAILGACADLAVAPRAGADGDSGVTGDPPAVGDREPGREPGQVDSRGLALAGVALVVVGLVLRYPVQHELKTLWWFGPWG